MLNEAIAKLRNRLSRNKLEDDDDLTIFVGLASRMKALGDSSEFNKIPEILERPEFKGRIDEIIIERCERGIYDCSTQDGEELALSIIEAQDYWLFQRYARSWLSAEALSALEEWADASHDEADVDEETESFLDDWKLTYPIPEEDLLPVVAYPVTEFERFVLHKIAQQMPTVTIRGHWVRKCTREMPQIYRQAPSRADMTAIYAVCDDGTPPEGLLKKQKDWSFRSESRKYPIRVLRWLNDGWKLILDITNASMVNYVQVGALAAKRSEKRPDRWIADLQYFDQAFQRNLLYAPVIIQCANGVRVEISVE